MALELQADPLPLRMDDGGTIRVGGARVTLDTVLDLFRQGATPEEITRRFPPLKVADVYGALAYYFNHRAEVEAYLAEGERLAEEMLNLIDERSNRAEFRERIMARWRARQAGS